MTNRDHRQGVSLVKILAVIAPGAVCYFGFLALGEPAIAIGLTFVLTLLMLEAIDRIDPWGQG